MPTFGWKLGDSPAPGDRWQGGEADPNGTQDQYGRQTGGRYVDPTYQTDANGNPVTPEQQAYWREQDRLRANASTREQAGYQAYKAAQANNPNASGLDYNNRTGQWQYYDTKTKSWVAGTSIDDIYGTIFTDKQRAEHPLFYYQNLQSQEDKNYDNDILANYRKAQGEAISGSPTTRYTPTRF